MKISHFPNNLPTNNDLVYSRVLSAIEKTDMLVENNMNADAALIWSVLWFGRMSANKRVWDHYRAQGKPVIVIEVGGLIRNKTWKLCINGINRDAEFAIDQGYDDSRLKLFGLDSVANWRKDGEYVVIAGQHAHSLQWEHMPNMETYYKQIVEEIRTHTNKPIVLRSHPRFRENIHFPVTNSDWFKQQDCEWNIAKQVHNTYDSFDFEDQLKHTYCVYSHSSNAGLTSIINGVPAVVSKHSLAYDVGSPSIDKLKRADRYDWLCCMSYIEWFADEIEVQWKRIRNKL